MRAFKNKKDINKFILQIFVVALSGIAGGATFRTFFTPAEIIPCGLSGLAQIIHNLFAQISVNIPTSIIYLVINVIIFSFALKIFGWKFLVLSGIGVGMYTLGMQFGAIPGIYNAAEIDVLLYAIVGSSIYGITIGLAFRFGGSTGGSDIAGAIINRYFPSIKTGYCILFINVIVIILTAITSGISTCLYALVVAVISSMATDLVLDGSKRVVSFYIVCDKDDEISNAIFEKFKRGVTRLEAKGMYSKQNKSMLLCLIPKENAHEMKKLVKEIDDNAFVFSASVTETIGEGNFMREMSETQTKIKKAKINIKNQNKYKIYKIDKKKRVFKRKSKFHSIKKIEV